MDQKTLKNLESKVLKIKENVDSVLLELRAAMNPRPPKKSSRKSKEEDVQKLIERIRAGRLKPDSARVSPTSKSNKKSNENQNSNTKIAK